MIWISTLCLLALAAWLLFNALNERRWVETHSHDETVASDPGLFSSLTALTASGTLDSDGKQENTKFASAVTTVKENTSKYSSKFMEAKKAAGQTPDGEVPPSSVSEDDSSFGRAVTKIGGMTGRLDEKLGKTLKAASEKTSKFGATGDSDEPLLSRVSSKVSASTEKLGDVVVAQAKSASQIVREKTATSRENGVLGKIAGTVSAGVNKLDGSAPKDLLNRITSKVGGKASEIDDKMTSNVGSSVNDLNYKVSATMGKKIGEIDDKLVKSVKESPAKESVD